MKKDEMIVGMKKLEVLYGKEFNDAQIEIWGDFFWQYSVEVFNETISEAIKTCRFMPTIADLCKIKEANDDKFTASSPMIFTRDGKNMTEYRYIKDEKRIVEVE